MIELLNCDCMDISKLTEAVAKAKTNFGPIIKNKTVKTPTFSYDYADLSSIEEAIQHALMEQGLTVYQPLTMIEGQRALLTILAHISGQWIRGIMLLSPYNGKIQDAGKEITYMRRYALCSMLCITAEDDIDGNEETERYISEKKRMLSEKKSPLTSQQAQTLQNLVKDHPDIQPYRDWETDRKSVV